MNILVATGLYPPEGGGPATYAKALFDELPKKGVGVTVLPFSRVRAYPKIVRHIAYFFLCLKHGKDVDVVYALDPVSVGVPSFFAAKLRRKKFSVKVVGDYAWEQGRQRFGVTDILDDFVTKKYGPRVGLFRFLQTMVTKGAVRVVVPSEYLKRIVSTWGVEKKKISVVYNAAPDVSSVGNKNVLRGVLKYHGKYIVTAARLVPWKGIDDVIKVVKGMREKGADVRLLIIGDGPERENLEKMAGDGDGVMLTGRLPNDITLAYIKAADAFVLNSGYEGLSHFLLEAQALGIPTAASDVGGNPEVITDGQNGLLFPYKDKKAIEKAIHKLLTDEPFRKKVIARSKRKAAKFSRERMINDTKAILEQIV